MQIQLLIIQDLACGPVPAVVVVWFTRAIGTDLVHVCELLCDITHKPLVGCLPIDCIIQRGCGSDLVLCTNPMGNSFPVTLQ